jgi:glycosyltransferase involved in cell wall biosynthesis
MDFDKNLISVVIPAYNQPEYLIRLLQSILNQTYRPIEIIVTDDCSPVQLEPVVAEFYKFENEILKIKFFRNATNLGVMGNLRFAVEQASGKYLFPFAHDNRLTDDNYFSDAIHIMQNNPDCYLSMADSIYENSVKKMFGHCEIGDENHWTVLQGDEFITKYRRGGLKYSQAMIIDHEIASSLRAYDEPFMIGPSLSRKLNIAQDNAFSFVFVLSAIGSVAITRKCVCEIGVPENSYSRTKSWQDSKKKVKFVVFFNIYNSELKGKYARVSKRMAFKQAIEYVDYIRDIKIIKYYNWNSKILLLVAFSFIKIPWFQFRQVYKELRRKFMRSSSPPKISKKDISNHSRPKSIC